MNENKIIELIKEGKSRVEITKILRASKETINKVAKNADLMKILDKNGDISRRRAWNLSKNKFNAPINKFGKASL